MYGVPFVTDNVPVWFQYGVVNDWQHGKNDNMMARISLFDLEEFLGGIPK